MSLPYLKKNVKKVLELLKLKDTSLDITLTNDLFIKKQNNKFMGFNKPTDVLSFPSLEVKKSQRGNPLFFKQRFLGDILISLDTAQKQALTQDISLQKEVLYLTLHSILHLMGLDHKKDKDHKTMLEIESQIWKKIHKPQS